VEPWPHKLPLATGPSSGSSTSVRARPLTSHPSPGGPVMKPGPVQPPRCCLPILRFGDIGTYGVTLRRFERRALMLFRSAKSWTERQLK
jgi:hypothetical protein